MRILSIFVDESGDFGEYNSKFAPQYILSMVFHEQDNNITDNIMKFNAELANLGYYNHVVHTSPLIRREYAYCNLSPNERRTIFTKLFYFTKNLPIKYKSFVIERKECKTESELKSRAIIEIERFINQYYEYFSLFDKVYLYYDNGQKQLASVLQEVLSRNLMSYERKSDVSHKKYKLLQVADMICTLELLKIKSDVNALSESETLVFHKPRDLKKDFINKLKTKEFP